MCPPLPPDDLRLVVESVGPLWQRLAGCRVLFTGASGFFGSWMLESFLHAGTQLALPVRALALTRDRSRFSQSLPHLAADPRVEILESDAATMPAPDGPVDFVIHSLFSPAPLAEMEEHFFSATARLLEIASQKSARGCLLCSTGAVYKPTEESRPISEGHPRFERGDPLSYPRIRSGIEDQWIGEGMRLGLPVTVARGFAFVGPRLPLDGQFAVGNFLRDALLGRPITVHGDGRPVRSYLHAADLAARLWHLVLNGDPGGIFNVGGDRTITVGDCASAVARLVTPTLDVRILSHDGRFSYYVPDTSRFDLAHGLPAPIPFSEALRRTWNWLQIKIRR